MGFFWNNALVLVDIYHWFLFYSTVKLRMIDNIVEDHHLKEKPCSFSIASTLTVSFHHFTSTFIHSDKKETWTWTCNEVLECFFNPWVVLLNCLWHTLRLCLISLNREFQFFRKNWMCSMVNWKFSQQELMDTCGFSRIKWNLNLKWNFREPFQSMNFFVKPSFQYELMGSCSFSRIKLLIVQFLLSKKTMQNMVTQIHQNSVQSKSYIYILSFFYLRGTKSVAKMFWVLMKKKDSFYRDMNWSFKSFQGRKYIDMRGLGCYDLA